MSIIVDDLRDMPHPLGDMAADEIESLERAYELLFKENAKLRAQADQQAQPVAHMFPSDLAEFQEHETFAQAYSVEVGRPGETTVPLFTSPPAQPQSIPPNGVQLIAAERQRQISVEGWTPEHDAEHDSGELASAAAAYALNAACLLNPFNGTPIEDTPDMWPWKPSWWKPKDPVSDLTRAGALIAAELDRIAAEENKNV